MHNRLRRLLMPALIVSISVGGLAYAAVEDEVPPTVEVEETPDQTPPGDPDETTEDDVTPSPDESTPPQDDEVTDTVDGDPEEVTPVVDTDEPEASHGPERSTEGCPEGFSGNHGQYVSGTEERPRNEAAKSSCGKPVHSDDAEDEDEDEGEDDDAGESDDDVEGS